MKMLQHSHIIQQQNIEIQFENFSDGMGIQNDIKDIFYEKLLPGIENLFDEITEEKYSISIEKLEIDCGSLNSSYWKEELVKETLRHLRNELIVHHKKETNDTEINKANSLSPDSFHSFLFFLEKGFLPWNSRIDSMKELEESITETSGDSKRFHEKLKALFKTKTFTIDRLLYNFSDDFFFKLFNEQLAENKKESLEKINRFLDNEKLTSHKKHIAHSLLLKIFGDEHADPDKQFYATLQSAIENAEKEKPIKKVDAAATNKETDSIYIQNAGLIILHPFLSELFTRLELLIDKCWKDISSQHIAVQVLEFLVSGNEEFPEFNLPLNKILCGLDISQVLQPVEELHPLIKSECEGLLAEVIRHWSILKNTSVEGLRETFLQRNGKMTQVDNGWLLNVEQKGVDVLLNSLPWGIGVIKLPWTDDTFFVEWT